jgi:hypothetical protein
MRSPYIVMLAAACALAGCKDNVGPQPLVLPAGLAATWVANTSCSPACTFKLTSVENPAYSVDVVANRVATVRLTLARTGSAELNFFGFQTDGTAAVNGSVLALTAGTSVDSIDFAVTPTTLTLDFRTPFEIYDLNGDQVVNEHDAAHAHAVLQKSQ